jgi:hypothetical protein
MKKYELKLLKPRNLIAKDLRSPKYRIRVEDSKKEYNRNTEKQELWKELIHV